MSFLEKLKNLFKVDININSPLVLINSNNKSHTNNDNRALYYDPQSKRNYLDFSKIKKDDAAIKEAVYDYLSSGQELLELETAELLYQLYDYQKTSDRKIIDFFRNIISPADLEALDASLFLRTAFLRRESHERRAKLKYDIQLSFGERGKNISNLCTAGYFENFLIPLYNSSQDKFNELYELIVKNSVLAVFVHQSMSKEEINSEVERKIAMSIKYGLKFVHIHGIGQSNVNRIKEYLENSPNSLSYEKKFFEKDNILIVELLI